MTLVIEHKEIVDLLSVDEVMQAVRASLDEQAAGEVQVPPRMTVESASGKGWLRLMPAIMNRSGYMGFKSMNSAPGFGVRYAVWLYDLASGALLAQLDADWITQNRTACTAAIGTDLLARQEIARVAVLGSSSQARALLSAVARVRAFEGVTVFSPTRENRERFAADIRAKYGSEADAVDSAEAAIAGADVVLSAIRAGRTPVINAACLEPGSHVTAVSSVRPEARELDERVWQRAAVVGVDDREHVFESGDGRAALSAGCIDPAHVAELWELASGTRAGRQSSADITLFKSVGTGLQDLAIALAIYRRARERGLGRELGDFPQPRLQGRSA